MGAESERGDRAEAPAAAAQGPEKIRFALGIAFDDPAVGGDDLGREQVIGGETPGSRQHADTAAKG